MFVRRIGTFCLLLSLAAHAHADAPRTFSEAKKIAWQLYAPQSTEFYCGCKYSGNRVNLAACGYVPRKNAGRAARVGAHRAGLADRYFYMSKQYGLNLSRQDRQLYEAWNKTYPVQGWEQQRNQRVACVMGHGNPWVGAVDLKACG